MSEKKFQVTVFGKTGCDKCKIMNKRLEELLVKPEWQDFDKTYHDLETEDGLVAYCRTECINPTRIPAMIVSKRNPTTGQYEFVTNPKPGQPDPVLKRTRLYSWLGLQTDYSDQGQGVVSPKMLTSVLDEARLL